MTKNNTAQTFGQNGGADQLRTYIERIERLNEERKTLSEDVNEVFAEAKSNGYDVKTMKELIKVRSKDPQEQEELESMLELYKKALGMV